MTSPFISAHFGHWYVSILYMAPVFALVLWLCFASWRDRRRGDDVDPPAPEADA
jgi:hypothetical protein